MKHLIIDLVLTDYDALLQYAKDWRDIYGYTYDDDDPQLISDYLLRFAPTRQYSYALENVEIEERQTK